MSEISSNSNADLIPTGAELSGKNERVILFIVHTSEECERIINGLMNTGNPNKKMRVIVLPKNMEWLGDRILLANERITISSSEEDDTVAGAIKIGKSIEDGYNYARAEWKALCTVNSTATSTPPSVSSYHSPLISE